MADLGSPDANHYTHVHITTDGGGRPTGNEWIVRLGFDSCGGLIYHPSRAYGSGLICWDQQARWLPRNEGDDSHAERHGDVDAPVAVFSCSRLGLQANPPAGG